MIQDFLPFDASGTSDSSRYFRESLYSALPKNKKHLKTLDVKTGHYKWDQRKVDKAFFACLNSWLLSLGYQVGSRVRFDFGEDPLKWANLKLYMCFYTVTPLALPENDLHVVDDYYAEDTLQGEE